MLTNIPHFDQWFGVWAIREQDFQAGYQWFMGLDLHLHMNTTGQQVRQEAAQPIQLEVRDGVATIRLQGTLMKQRASMSSSTSTQQARRQIRAAVRNPDVGSIILSIESPGGTAAGTLELAQDVAAAAKQKPVYAFIEDLGASAAYWVASQATQVFANPTAIVGSIGTYGVVYDQSGAAAKEGIKVHVIRAGEMKGAFTPGTEVTAEQLAEQQKLVTSLNEFFIRGVADGRGFSLSQARELADGRVYVGQAAVDRKLIDAVQTSDQTFLLAAKAAKRSTRMSIDIAAETSVNEATPASPAPVAAESNSASQAQASAAAPATSAPRPATEAVARPATLTELKAACPGASNDFVVSQMEANATVNLASTAYMAQLLSEKTALTKQVSEQTVAAAAAPLRKPGAAPVPAGAGSANSTTATGGDAIAQWEEAVQTLMTDRKLSQAKAIQALAHDEPQLHAAYLADWNAKHARVRK